MTLVKTWSGGKKEIVKLACKAAYLILHFSCHVVSFLQIKNNPTKLKPAAHAYKINEKRTTQTENPALKN